MLNRHDLIYVKLNALPCSEHQSDELAFFRRWISNRFPLIYTRQFGELSEENSIKLGLPYFNAETNTKYRYSFSLKKQDIQTVAELPSLSSIFPTQVNKTPFNIGVYGSHAWQYLTCIKYVQKTSDLDVLIHYQGQSFEALEKQLKDISQIENINRVDGEIRLPKFGDCQIQEFMSNDSTELLFKTTNDVALIKRDIINAEYPKLAIK
jgi:phosphoribosyl-dephospho-CoA transferase